MTRKHFQMLAEAVASIIESYEQIHPEHHEHRARNYHWIVNPIDRVCHFSNPNFHSARFIEAVEKELEKSLDTVTA